MAKKIEKTIMGKGAIFRALDITFIKKLFRRKKKLFFPSKKEEILEVKIERISPDWAKESCLARYKILFNDGSQKIIRGSTKVDRTKKRNWQIMKYLYSHSFKGSNLRIRKPLGYIENTNLLLYEEAPGVILTEIIKKGNKKVIEKILKKTARWLIKLHDLNLGQKKFPKAVFIGLNGYKSIFKKIKKYMPEIKDKLIPVKKLNFINKIWQDKKTLIHNDFYPGNCISNKDIIFGIDFDCAGRGPFLMDLATFYGALEFPKEIWNLGFSKEKIRHLQNTFLREYCKLKKLEYLKIKNELNKFLVKIYLDQVHYYTAFAIKGWNFIDNKTKEEFILKTKSLLLKIKQYLKNL